MRELVGFWIVCMSVIAFLVFLLSEDIKTDALLVASMGAFLGMLEFGTWLIGGQ